ncbi:MAG: PTS transporter subunit EIIC [Solobacterium sp.]|nr:PTS transporter subunit EIIC [Solobacterium sp.]
MDVKETAALFTGLCGGENNILSVQNCMTRVRLTVADPSAVNADELKKQEDVLGVIAEGESVQIVVGPGKSAKIAEAMHAQVSRIAPAENEADRRKAAADARNSTPFKLFLKRIAGIFIPLIPAFMGCGLLLAACQFCGIYVPGFRASAAGRILGTVSSSIFEIMPVIIGYNAARDFGGSPAIGAVLAYVLGASSLNGIKLLGTVYAAGRGGIISVLAAAILGALFEKKVRAVMPDALDTCFSPLIVIFVMTFASMTILQPVCGFVSDAVGSAVTYIIYNTPALAGLASLFYLPLVATGMHHGMLAVNTQLIADLGMTYLLPVTCMAGAGQVGPSLYVMLKTRSSRLKKICRNALPAGILGIGEPLMWGVTIPLGRPFIASCIGGGIGGSAIAVMKVAALIPGLSGIQLSLVTNAPFKYLLGILISYAAGFAACLVLGFDDSHFE